MKVRFPLKIPSSPNDGAEVRSARAAATDSFPPLPYPNGWFSVGRSVDIPAGKVVRQQFMGQDVVVYRTRSGLVRVTQPYCPHLGAHLGIRSRVDGENLVCPFHGFTFDPSGTCVKTGTGDPPPKIGLTLLPTCEVNGIVLAWWHSDGAAPDWEVRPVDTSGFPPPRSYTCILHDHPQDIMENSFDLAHLPVVHGLTFEHDDPPTFDDTTIRYTVRTKADKSAEGKYAAVPAEIRSSLGSKIGPFAQLPMRSEIAVSGLGWVWVKGLFPLLGMEYIGWVLPTPLDPTHLSMRILLSARTGAGRDAHKHVPPWHFLASRLMTQVTHAALVHDLKKDFPMWQNKIYAERPRLVKGDGPIMAYRRWARQFYNHAEYDAIVRVHNSSRLNGMIGNPAHRLNGQNAEHSENSADTRESERLGPR
ncbi:Rieske 2Fe-2S domain-containing protein [Nocardia brasiliensis]